MPLLIGQTSLHRSLHNFRERERCAKFHPHPLLSNLGGNYDHREQERASQILAEDLQGSLGHNHQGWVACVVAQVYHLRNMRPAEG